jgi:hypothetical protein
VTFRGDGRKYEGEWKNGVQEGNGEFFTAEGTMAKKGVWRGGQNIQWFN